MHQYIIQYRAAHGDALILLGQVKARTENGALLQGIKWLTQEGQRAVQVVVSLA